MADVYEVIVSEPAGRDLQYILQYLLEEASEQVARDVQKLFLKAIEGLQDMPTAHSLVGELNHIRPNTYRRIVIKKAWRIIYEIEEQSKSVYVLRILHVKRSPDFVKKSLE